MKRKLLVVDDDEGIQKIIKRTLASGPYEIFCANDGVEAIRMAFDLKPDLVLMDVDMPRMDGRRALRELRATPQTSMIPIILLTSHGDLSEKVSGLEVGADDYITKPFEVLELTARVEGILRRNSRALWANPLTLLPGGPTIEEEVNRRIREKHHFAFLYLDIDNFKAFNDAYGYANGDKIIKDVANLLLETARSVGQGKAFVGHVGGDDFVMVVEPGYAEAMAKQIAECFDQKIPLYYTPEDRDRGFIVAKNRQGQEQRFPVMTLTIAIVTNDNRNLEHYAKAVDIAAEIKRHLKTRNDRKGSAYLKDRRLDSCSVPAHNPLDRRQTSSAANIKPMA